MWNRVTSLVFWRKHIGIDIVKKLYEIVFGNVIWIFQVALLDANCTWFFFFKHMCKNKSHVLEIKVISIFVCERKMWQGESVSLTGQKQIFYGYFDTYFVYFKQDNHQLFLLKVPYRFDFTCLNYDSRHYKVYLLKKIRNNKCSATIIILHLRLNVTLQNGELNVIWIKLEKEVICF